MEENQPNNSGPGLPGISAIIYLCLALLPACEALSSKGSSCSACEVVDLLFVPVYLLAYALLLPAAFWIQRPGYAWSGIGSALLVLLSMGIGLALLEGTGGLSKASAIMLVACGVVTLGGIVLGFRRKLQARK